MILPEPLREDFVDEVVGRVLDHFDLLDDHFLLALDVLGSERRISNDVGQDVDGERQMLVEHLDVVACVLLRRERVELASDRVDLLSDVLGRSRRRAFEEHVLNEVRDPAAVSRLVPRSPRQPDANADRTDLRHPLGQNTKAVIENISDDG